MHKNPGAGKLSFQCFSTWLTHGLFLKGGKVSFKYTYNLQMENTSKPCKWGISNSNQALHPKGSLKFPRKFLQGSLFSGLCTLCSSRNKSCSNDGPLYLILVPFIIPFLQKCTLPLASVKLYVFLFSLLYVLSFPPKNREGCPDFVFSPLILSCYEISLWQLSASCKISPSLLQVTMSP